MPNLLKELELVELSLVDSPANPLAKAPIFKRDDSKGEDMPNTVIKHNGKELSVEDAQKILDETLQKSEDTTKENERLRKALIDNGFVIKAESVEKKEVKETIEVDGEQINKADIPAPVLKALELANKEAEDLALEKRAEETLPHFEKDVAKEILKTDWDEAIMNALIAADAAFEAAMDEVGKQEEDAGDLSEANSKLDKMVDEYAAKNKVDKYAAYAEVVKTAEGKALVQETYKKD